MIKVKMACAKMPVKVKHTTSFMWSWFLCIPPIPGEMRLPTTMPEVLTTGWCVHLNLRRARKRMKKYQDIGTTA